MANSYTRFRAYQLKEKGASFSYVVDNHFTLIEARYNEVNKPRILREMKLAGCSHITRLHITSWDEDHCKEGELKAILEELKPSIVEAPGYEPDTDNGRNCMRIVNTYLNGKSSIGINFTPKYISGLTVADTGKFTDVVFAPTKIMPDNNDNSTAKLFRKGRFTVLSLGDLMSSELADEIASSTIARQETDVMLVAHHGADNGFTTASFLKKIAPKVSICCNEWGNQYEHPDDKIVELFKTLKIPFYNTKTGDVICVCDDDNTVHVYNLCGDNNRIQNEIKFRPKMTF